MRPTHEPVQYRLIFLPTSLPHLPMPTCARAFARWSYPARASPTSIASRQAPSKLRRCARSALPAPPPPHLRPQPHPSPSPLTHTPHPHPSPTPPPLTPTHTLTLTLILTLTLTLILTLTLALTLALTLPLTRRARWSLYSRSCRPRRSSSTRPASTRRTPLTSHPHAHPHPHPHPHQLSTLHPHSHPNPNF